MGFFDKEDWMYDSPDEAYAGGHDEGLSSGVGNKMAHDMGFKDGQSENIKQIRNDFQTFDNAIGSESDNEVEDDFS